MMANAQLAQQLKQELQNELTTSNQLLRLISVELQQIKQITSTGGEFEENIIKNTFLTAMLAKMQQIDIDNLPSVPRLRMDLSNNVNQNHSGDRGCHDSNRETSAMDDSQ